LISGSSDYEVQCVLFDIEPIGVRLDNLARSIFDVFVIPLIVSIYYCQINAHLKSCVDSVSLIYYLVSFVELIAMINRFYRMLEAITNFNTIVLNSAFRLPFIVNLSCKPIIADVEF
jgi:hypothetical protein